MSKVIKMFYELKDAQTGDILESNMGISEIGFVTGKNQVLEALEAGVINLNAGDTTEIKILAKDALGEYDESAVQVLPREQFAGVELQVGGILFGENEDGSTIQVVVKDISDESVTIDYNHPYAGKDLLFNIKVTENRPADADEEATGVVVMPHVCACGHDEQGCCGGHGHGDDECCGGHEHGENGGCCGKHKH